MREERTQPAGESAPLPINTEVFQREALRMKLAGTRRGTTVALAGVLQGFTEAGAASETPEHRSVSERVFDFSHITSDPATRELIDTGRTMGCFYIESPGMRALFERLHCRSYDEVVAASSIIRPGVAESGMMQEYVARHMEQAGSAAATEAARGRKAAIHPIMQQVLPETYGVMVYQEDVLRVAHEVAGLSYSEADLLRRAMSGKGRSDESMRRLRERFQEGTQSRGLSDEDAEEIWRQMASFAGYSFCKGHSAAFAVLSYQVTYLKAHYPAEFFAAVLTNQGGFYGAGAYLEEARRCGLQILGLSVNESEADYTGCTLPSGEGMKPGGGWIRIGLGAVLGLSSDSRHVILEEREEGGPYSSLPDFLERTRLEEEECRALIKAGALDCLAEAESESLKGPDAPGREAARIRPILLLKLADYLRRRDLTSGTLFQPIRFSLWKGEAAKAPVAAELSPEPAEEFNMFELCAHEIEHLGFSLTAHPIDLVQLPADIVPARDIRDYAGKRIRMAGLAIAGKLLEARNSGQMMKMLTLEDRTNTFEAILFPRVYARYAPRTLGAGPFIVEGKVDISLGSPTINVERIELAPQRKDV